MLREHIGWMEVSHSWDGTIASRGAFEIKFKVIVPFFRQEGARAMTALAAAQREEAKRGPADVRNSVTWGFGTCPCPAPIHM